MYQVIDIIGVIEELLIPNAANMKYTLSRKGSVYTALATILREYGHTASSMEMSKLAFWSTKTMMGLAKQDDDTFASDRKE
jgi:hypothetical protein